MSNSKIDNIAKYKLEVATIEREYIEASEDLLNAANELAARGDIAVQTLKPSYEGPFMAAWIKDQALKDCVKEFGVSSDTKDFILGEMIEIAKMNRKIIALIRAKIKELPV